jgi:pimeloyl-ACP methyl ester carboxylesterase
MKHRPHALLVTLLTAPILLLGILYIYQSLSEAADLRMYPMRGQLVDIGGYRLHLDCSGEGRPTVVLESGLGGPALEWTLVQQELEGTTRVCSYDRAGLGWSDAGPLPRSANEMASELHTLLHKAGIEGPYVLVGHSLGGFVVRSFAHEFPGETAGIVLVASGSENDIASMPPEYVRIEEANKQTDRLLAALAPFGVMRIAGTVGLLSSYTKVLANLPPQAKNEFVHFTFYRSQYWATSLEELSALNETRAEMASTGSLDDLPLVVLSGSPDLSRLPPNFPAGEMRTEFAVLQDQLAALSTQSSRIECASCDHYIPLTNPGIVVNAIDQEIAKVGAR